MGNDSPEPYSHCPAGMGGSRSVRGVPQVSVFWPVCVALVMSVRPISVKAHRKLTDCCSFGRLLMVRVSCEERRPRQRHGQVLVKRTWAGHALGNEPLEKMSE